MTDRPVPAGRVRGPVRTHPLTQRPAVWLEVDGRDFPAREIARANGGQAVLVSWTDGSGLGREEWMRASQVRERRDDLDEDEVSRPVR